MVVKNQRAASEVTTHQLEEEDFEAEIDLDDLTNGLDSTTD